MIAIIDYGVGNLFSLKGSLNALSLDCIVTGDEAVIKNADKIILPGVGAFGAAAEKLRRCGLDELLIRQAASGKPFLGICLGMQLLFDVSYEFGKHNGLGLIPGRVCPVAPDISADLKVPHMGWNSLKFKKPSRLFKYISEGDYVYYVHSYYAKGCQPLISAVSDYGIEITGAVERGNVYGTQFHPEKSGSTGLKLLKAFGDIKC